MVPRHDRCSVAALLLCFLFLVNVATAYIVPSWMPLVERQDLNLTISEDGKCGGKTGQTCQDSTFGNCCSAKGWCGSETDYCAAGCQSEFGTCPSSLTSTDGSCGGPTSITCLGSDLGDCCSARGYCGSNSSYCGAGCQSSFGSCGSSSVSSDGSCGGPQGVICQGSDFGNCCSERGYCGANASFCGAGCQTKFGTCFPAASTPVDLSTATMTDLSTVTPVSAVSNAPGTAAASSTSGSTLQPADKGVSGGAIGGAVVGALAGVALIGAGLFFLRRRRKTSMHPTQHELPNDVQKGELPDHDFNQKFAGNTFAAKELPASETTYEMPAHNDNYDMPKSQSVTTQPVAELGGSGRDEKHPY